MSKNRVDVAIIGGGPAGSATAAYLSRAGIDCLVLEKEIFPRPHVGESLVTSTTRVFRDLGFLETMEEEGFVRKYGAAWTSNVNPDIFAVSFEGTDRPFDDEVSVRFDERQQEGVDQDYTYHVDRGRFDHLLLLHAADLGARVWEGAAVHTVDFSEQPFVRIGVRRGDSDEEVLARMVVDASGRRTFLGNKLGYRITDPVFDQYALHTWFEGYDRGEGENSDYIFIHFLPLKNTWLWQIPITDTITSIGVVTQKKRFREANKDMEGFFWESLATRPDLYHKLRRAQQIRPLKPEGDYSYSMREICGDRFVLVGDAARFVDPIFSSGVSIALTSAKIASEEILEAAEAGSFDAGAFERYKSLMRRGCTNWYKFIAIYYRLNVLFTYFIQDPRYRLEVLRLLQGDVYDETEPEALRKMREVLEVVERDEGHVWYPYLGELNADAFEPEF